MDLDFFTPIDEDLFEWLQTLHPSTIGQTIKLNTAKSRGMDFDNIQIAILGIPENRREKGALHTHAFDFNPIRKAFYSLFSGKWELNIADLGNILPGEDIDDTEYALRETLHYLIEKNIFAIVLGGSQDLTYAQYRAYDFSNKMINLVNIDSRFDIGDTDSQMTDHSYIGKMIVDEPHRLFNYANIGYQSYLNPPEEIELIEGLYFEAYRLGEIAADITLSEPILRDADIVSMDMNTVVTALSTGQNGEPNGFNGREICTLARYTGISDRVSSFGCYNLHHRIENPVFAKLTAQILWYLIEGINYRKNEYDFPNLNGFLKYNVPLNQETLVFYQSKKSNRWWMELPLYHENQMIKKTYLPCSHQDYKDACSNEIPERWYKARQKNEL